MRAQPLLFVILIIACGGGPSLIDLTPWSPPRPQTCQTIEPTGTVDLILDSAAFADRVAGLDLPDGTLLMSVAADSGEVHWIRPIESSFPEDASFRLEAAMADAVAAPRGGAEARGRVVARVRAGALDTLALSAFQTCRPAAANADRVAEVLERAYERLRITGQARIQMFVDENGRVTEVEIAESSGIPALDIHFLMVARSVTFHPARIDRHPIGVWVSMPFSVERGGR